MSIAEGATKPINECDQMSERLTSPFKYPLVGDTFLSVFTCYQRAFSRAHSFLPSSRREDHVGDHHEDDFDASVHLVRQRQKETQKGKQDDLVPKVSHLMSCGPS